MIYSLELAIGDLLRAIFAGLGTAIGSYFASRYFLRHLKDREE